MGRKLITLSSSNPYHIYGRSNNKDWFYTSRDECWQIFLENLIHSQRKFQLTVHSFVLMSNHYHLKVTTPQANISEVMREFLTQTSKSINSRSGRINHVFGGRYKWKLILDQFYYYNAHKYIYRNPVEAGVVKRAEEYKYSTVLEELKIQSRIKLGPSPFGHLIPEHKNEYLTWLNINSEESIFKEISNQFKAKKAQ